MCWKKTYIILLIKILTNWKSIHYLFLLNEKHLALMYDKTSLNTLQLSFLLISQQRYYMGTVIPILQKKKKILGVREIQVSCTSENNWPLGGSELSISSLLAAVSTDWSPPCAQWMQDRAHLTPLESEGKEHTCCSVLGSVLNWEYVQKLRAKQGGLWKVCHRWNGQRIYEC